MNEKHMRARREALRALRQTLSPGKPLDEVQWLDLKHILDTIDEGYDIREWYGIKPKTGAPPSTRSLQKWIALHYLALCAEDPDNKKDHRGVVAKSWGIADSRVTKLADRHGADVAPLVRSMTVEDIIENARLFQPEYRRLTRNAR